VAPYHQEAEFLWRLSEMRKSVWKEEIVVSTYVSGIIRQHNDQSEIDYM
jgi:hypothetical protein